MPEYKFEVLDPEVSEQTDDGYRHKACGELLVGITVHLSNRNGLMPLSGDGSVTDAIVPYCENCQEEPPRHGEITDDGVIRHPSFVEQEQS